MLFRESVTSTTALKDPGTNLVTTSDRMALFIQAAGCIGGRRYSMRVPPQTLTTVFLFRLVMNYCGITSHSVVSCLRIDC